MPINPQIVTAQLPGIQIENPMTFARNALAMKQAQSEIAANELAAREAQGFNQLVSATVIKNCEPFVFGPAFAIASK